MPHMSPVVNLVNVPDSAHLRMPPRRIEGNINLTNLPANPRPQYTGLVDPALAASPIDPSVLLRDGLAGSQLVEDPRSWSSLGNRVAGTAAGLLLGKAAGAALSPKLIGSLAASVVGGLPMPENGGVRNLMNRIKKKPTTTIVPTTPIVPTNTIVKTDGLTARQIFELEEAKDLEIAKPNEPVPKKIIPETEEEIEYRLIHGSPPAVPLPNVTKAPTSPPSAATTAADADAAKNAQTSTPMSAREAEDASDLTMWEADPDLNTTGIKAYTINVNKADQQNSRGVYVPQRVIRQGVGNSQENSNIIKAGESTAKVDMSLAQIEELAHRDSYYRDVRDKITAGTYSTPVKQKLFKDHVGRVIAPPRDEGGNFVFAAETMARNKALLSDINNVDLFRNYFKALSPEHPLLKGGVLKKTEANGKVFFELNPERTRDPKNTERDAQSSGNLIIQELKRNFPNAKTGYGGDLDSYNQGINAAKADANRRAAEEIATTPKSRTIQVVQNTNPEGATIDRYPIARGDMTQEEIATSINRQNFVRLNGDDTLYLVSPKRLRAGANPSKAVNHDMGTGDSPVHPPGELNISGTRKSWELGKMMHEKSKALDPNTPKESVTWETMDGQTHTKHLLKMTRDDTNEFVEHYNRKVSPTTVSGEKIRGFTQIFGLGGAAAGASLMAPPDTRRAPERY